LNFLQSAERAAELTGVKIINKTGIAEGQQCYEAAAELVDMGCDIVFADSFGHEDYMIEAAREFPDVEFCHATGTQAHTVCLPNFHNAFASIYEGRYLAGVAAGLKLNEMIAVDGLNPEDAKMGYIGAYPYAEVKSGYTSFFLGARSVCPSATMEVVFTNSWYDETLEKEGANRLIQNGCVLISQHADSMGAPSACETAGVPNVSYNGSMMSVAPNTYIVSSKIDWTPYFVYIIDCVKNGHQIDMDWTGTIETGSVVLTEINEAVAAVETAEVIEAVKAELMNGTRHVFDISTFTVNGETLKSYLADVDSDPAYTPDTEVIGNGYFHESEYRSAPYFDLDIDGIILLDQ
jgi:basic membrane protein A